MEIQVESSEGESFLLISTLDIEERKKASDFLNVGEIYLNFH